jgi:hypothetical protein
LLLIEDHGIWVRTLKENRLHRIHHKERWHGTERDRQFERYLRTLDEYFTLIKVGLIGDAVRNSSVTTYLRYLGQAEAIPFLGK